MIAALLLAAAPAMTAIDAERAFAADAQKLGQWTAFKAWSTPDALLFTPQPTNAHQFLKDRKDPAVAVFWWPGASFVSCDGSYAVNTGPWVREWGKSVGYFTTIWQRQADGGWKWIYDGGDGLKQPRAQGGDIQARTASCDPLPGPPAAEKKPPSAVGKTGWSADGTLKWSWSVRADGARELTVLLWNGKTWDMVLNDNVAAPAP